MKGFLDNLAAAGAAVFSAVFLLTLTVGMLVAIKWGLTYLLEGL